MVSASITPLSSPYSLTRDVEQRVADQIVGMLLVERTATIIVHHRHRWLISRLGWTKADQVVEIACCPRMTEASLRTETRVVAEAVIGSDSKTIWWRWAGLGSLQCMESIVTDG